MPHSLRRYTELPYALDYLRTREIALLSPKSWDDRNDSYYLEAYARTKGLNAVYALCLTEANETYHHWKVFSSGSSGICIVFKKQSLLEWAKSIEALRVESVKYRTIDQCKKYRPELEDLPFLKREAFRDELEFRLFATPTNNKSGPFRLHLPFAAVDRIVINPWLPKSVADHVKATIRGLEGCKSMKVYRSSLIENESWKRFAPSGA